jgi:ribonuclease HI
VNTEMDALGTFLFEFEKQLMDPEFRRDRERVSSLLHEDFREFGSSGREWNREGILDLLQTEPLYLQPDIVDFKVMRPAQATVLVTYRAERDTGSSLRSSLWVRDGDRWRMLFHQGTKIPQA